VVGVLATIALLAFRTHAMRMAAVGGALATLLIAPSVWAFETLGYSASGTFPAGGPASVADGGGPGGGFGGFGGRGGTRPGVGAIPQLFGPPGGAPPAGGATGAAPMGSPPGLPGARGSFGAGFAVARGRGGPGGGFGGGSIEQALAYVKAHGGGTIAVSSQSSAASAILEGNANVAGIGGFSGRESDPSVTWLAQEVSTGKIRWVVGEQRATGGGFGGRLPGDTRAGSRAAMAAVEAACSKVTLPASTTATSSAVGAIAGGATSSSTSTLYDCEGRASALVRA
jgi:hypothetical protein